MYDIPNKCKMEELRAQEIFGFKPEMGYGYYEFKEEEYLNLNKNVVLMHKVIWKESHACELLY